MMWRATSSPSTARRPTSRAHPTTFPDVQTNVVPLHVSMGACNAQEQSDAHCYWEFNYQGTNWVHPLYELPFTGGFPDNFGQAPDTFQDGEIGALQSIVPALGQVVKRTNRRRSVTTPTCRAIPTSLTRTTASMLSANSASVVFRAASPTRYFSMSTKG